MNKITLEDINTWLMKYEYQTHVFTLDCSKTMGNYGIYSIEGVNIRNRYVKLSLPEDVKLYYPSGGLSYNEQKDWIILQDGDFQLTVILTLNAESAGGSTKFRNLDWHPISPTKCLQLPRDDLEHRKLFLNIKDNNITSINYKEIKYLDGNPYVTYGDIYNSLADDVLWSNIDEGSRYPFKIIKIPSCPHISVEKELYLGNNNSITDLISLSSDNIEYKIYYNGKELKDNIFIPRDYNEDTIRLRVVTKSYEPYVGTDVYIDVPITRKLLTTLEDLNTYSYGIINELDGLTGEINNDITIKGVNSRTIKNCNLVINGKVNIEDITHITDCKIINNNYLEIVTLPTLAKCTILFKNVYDNFKWINNGELIIDEATISGFNGFILNNSSLKITNTEFNYHSEENLPALHSTTEDVELNNNNFTFKYIEVMAEADFKGYNICIIRSNTFDADKFLSENTTDYNCNYLHDNETYTVNGNGIAYCLIDDDSIRFKNLEIIKTVNNGG